MRKGKQQLLESIRFVETKTVLMSQIVFDKNNPNVMSDEKHKALDKVITRYGFAKDPWLNDQGNGTYLVIDGEQGIKRLQDHGVKKFSAKIFKVKYSDVRKLRQIANKLHGIHDKKKDADEFRALFEDGQLEEFADFLAIPIDKFEKELSLAFDDISFGKENENYIPELPKIPKSKLGDIYQLGNHLVICGDCTNPELRAKLFENNKPDVIFTDPPYSSGGKQETGKSQGSIGSRLLDKKTGKRNIRPKIKMDNLSTRGYIHLIKSVLFEIEADALYMFTDWRMWDWTRESAEASEFPVKQMIVWDKLTPGMGIQWRGQHELICYAKRSALGGPYHKGNVISVARSGNENHPTEKPIELLTELLGNTNGKTIYDPFLGSGSTIIACEELKRNCVGFELDPKFMDVIIQRWEKFTGKKAKKQN